MRRIALAAVLALGAAGLADGARQTTAHQPTARQVAISDPGAKEICTSVGQVDLPAADMPNADERNALAGCTSLDLYYGFGVAADPVRARKCAYVEMEKGESEPVFGGRTLLMMVYANGKGARRNFDAALKLACSIGGAPQDIAGRVHQLARLKAANWTGDTFSICDHSSGRELYEQCAILQERFDAPKRAEKLAAITHGWTAEEQAAFIPLRRAADRFFAARAGREVNLQATVETQERAFLEDRLIDLLIQFDRGDTPGLTADDLRESEVAMQRELAATQQGGPRKWGTVTSEAINETQQLWMSYRDAWVEFAKTKYPAVSGVSWRAWLTQERVDMLSRFAAAGAIR